MKNASNQNDGKAFNNVVSNHEKAVDNVFHTQSAQQPTYAATLTGQASYDARIMPDTVLSDGCEKFYRQPENVASTDGYSSKDFEKRKQPNCLPSIMSEKSKSPCEQRFCAASLIGNIDVRSLVSPIYKKQTAMDFHNFKLHMELWRKNSVACLLLMVLVTLILILHSTIFYTRAWVTNLVAIELS
nr:hypothetical protein [Tanacetum cinerariifolium]